MQEIWQKDQMERDLKPIWIKSATKAVVEICGQNLEIESVSNSEFSHILKFDCEVRKCPDTLDRSRGRRSTYKYMYIYIMYTLSESYTSVYLQIYTGSSNY